MLVISIVGRPNVGKSTLFNCLTRTKDALVINLPGTTRDRKYGEGKVGIDADVGAASANEVQTKPYIVIDTGGIGIEEDDIDQLMSTQSWQAVEEADVILFVVDAKYGAIAPDEIIANKLRRYNKKTIVVVNKVDGLNENQACADFYKLGFENLMAIAASHRRGIKKLADNFLAMGRPVSAEPQATLNTAESENTEESDTESLGIKIAIIGKPNVGKSTLVNKILGEDRVIAFDSPGTTRDSIYIPFKRKEQKYTIIDTAGVRRRAKVTESLEKFSIVKALKAIEDSNVVVLMIDAREGVTDQDLNLLEFTIDAGKAIVIAVNKWDDVNLEQKQEIKKVLGYKLNFVNFAKQHFISALNGKGIGRLFASIDVAYRSATKTHTTSKLTKILQKLIEKHPPPMRKGRRIKLRYAHPGGYNPPRVIIHGNQTDKVPASYKRYLTNNYFTLLKLEGTPIKIEFKSGDNPYDS